MNRHIGWFSFFLKGVLLQCAAYQYGWGGRRGNVARLGVCGLKQKGENIGSRDKCTGTRGACSSTYPGFSFLHLMDFLFRLLSNRGIITADYLLRPQCKRDELFF